MEPVDFDIREVGRSLPRATTQRGWVERKGKHWIGYWKVRETLPDGTPGPWKRRQRVVGSEKKYPTKALAEDAHRVFVERETSQTQINDEEMNFSSAWNRFEDFKARSGKWGEHHHNLLIGIVAQWILPFLGPVELREITPANLNDILLRMKAAGLSKERVKKAKQILSMVLDFAEGEQWLEFNPTRSKRFSLPSIKKTDSTVPEVEEMAAFLQALSNDRYLKLRVLLRLGVQAGGRSGELRCLRWNDVHPDHLVIDEAFHRYAPAGQRIGEPKTELSNSTVAIPRGLYDDLMAWKAVVQPKSDLDWVFPSLSSRGYPADFDGILRKEIRKVEAELIEAEVKIPKLNWRMLRSACASYFTSDVKSAQRQLRHSKANMTVEVYMKPLSAEVKSKVAEIDSKLFPGTDQGTDHGADHGHGQARTTPRKRAGKSAPGSARNGTAN